MAVVKIAPKKEKEKFVFELRGKKYELPSLADLPMSQGYKMDNAENDAKREAAIYEIMLEQCPTLEKANISLEEFGLIVQAWVDFSDVSVGE